MYFLMYGKISNIVISKQVVIELSSFFFEEFGLMVDHDYISV